VLFGSTLGICLYATVFVLPVYLQSVQGFTAEQTGFVILPGALASAFTMAFMGRLQGRFDGRYSILVGVGLFVLSMWKHAHFTTDSGMGDFFWPLVFRGVGLGLIFVPLTNLALADLPLGKIHNGTGLFNLMRQLGGSVGIALSATLLQRFTAIHRSDLMASVTPYAAAAQQRVWQIQTALLAKGTPPALVQDKALRLLDAAVRKQALMLSFEQLFLLFGGAFMISLPVLLFMHRPEVAPGGGAAH
jgi:DHA2 family multidrug resistance protein